MSGAFGALALVGLALALCSAAARGRATAPSRWHREIDRLARRGRR